ncbi:MAG: hypothetical protein ACE5IP_07035 [Terriglobia bacterium]
MRGKQDHLMPIALVVAGGFAFHLAGGQELPTLNLGVKDVVVVEQNFGPLFVKVPVQCDAEQNVYVRKYQRDMHASPILRISRAGKPEGSFTIRDAPGFEAGQTDDLAVGLRGEVYILGLKEAWKWHIVKFSRDGEYRSLLELEPFLEAHSFAVFASGEFLVAGEQLVESERGPKRTGIPLLALYDSSGEFIREISLPRDVAPKGEDTGRINPSLTDAVPADDGNIYLMRRAPSPVVYVISSAGTVLRRLVIAPPTEGFEPLTMKVAGGRIVIQFREKKRSGSFEQQIFSVVDALTGEKFADYWSTPETGGIWACYSADGFTFLGTTQTEPLQMTLVHATPY